MDTATDTEVKITEVFPSGMAYQARIHAAGCRDIQRDFARMDATTIGTPELWTGEYTGGQWLDTNFGDVAADTVEPDSEGWTDELRLQASEVTICKCAQDKGFHF